ncbi:hypothetical protein TRFO_06597 [Tritrichomonas foetus]|uniref:Lecithin:cholesterol acyltransferase family protein n=1 Tax=Tritrichomonas foetus TaxID=1144522 RepID=A0A1J4JYI5_9EUKA|nr:hypothetical protein TRFO_06597 [Tritrichomonas foetus]|eukprot:OHT03754.1 hypothetical protein TRFO_06597 [Tritrichomonas foetus]
MFFTLLSIAFALKPVILIHGHGGTKTYGHLTKNVDKCPQLDRYEVWPPNSAFADQYPDCIAYFLDTKIDDDGTVHLNPEVVLELNEFGDISSIPAFQILAPYLEEKGYTRMKDLFGVPYNWITYPSGTPELFPMLKEKIEKIVEENGEKAVLLGHSMGTHVVRTFINDFSSREWVRKYIDGLVFNAPAFYGCFVPFSYTVTGRFSSLKYTDYVAEISRKMPSIQVMYNNYHAFKDTVVFANTKSGNITSSNVQNYLIENGYISDEGQKLFKLIEKSLKEDPVEPPVRSLILYNSGIPTLVGYEGENLEKEIYGGGDTACHAGGPQYVCSKWKKAECVDWNINSGEYSHSPMLSRPEALDRIFQFINESGSVEPESESLAKKWTIAGIACAVVSAAVIVIMVIIGCRKTSKIDDYDSIKSTNYYS